MLEQAQNVLKERRYGHLSICGIKVIHTSNAVNEAREAVKNGADIIIARGLQAMHIKEHTNIPVVEIMLTGQELGLLVMQAKKAANKERPHIAFVGNVFSDMSHFEELFGITLSLFYYRNMDEHLLQITRAVESGADIIIGGDLTNQQARKYGVPSLFFSSTEESIGEALRVADLTGYAIDVEKRQTAQMEALLDTYTNGIIMIDINRCITKANHIIVEMLNKSEAALQGLPIQAVLPEIDVGSIDHLLSGTSNVYHTNVQIGERPAAIWATSFTVDGRIIGATLVCHNVSNSSHSAHKSIKNMYLRGYTAHGDLRRLSGASVLMNKVADTAKLYAMSQKPVLITGEIGTEKDMVAQGIHKASARKNGPYISVDCAGFTGSEQELILFGNIKPAQEKEAEKGALEVSNYGTLFLNDIDALTLDNQYRIFRTIHSQAFSYNNIRPGLLLDIRLIASTSRDLEELTRGGLFRQDLYYLLQALVIELPPFRKREEDRYALIKAAMEAGCEIYHRQITPTAEAWEILTRYDWPGNLIQIRAFCERLVLTAPKQKVDAAFVRYLINSLYKQPGEDSPAPQFTGSVNPEAARITAMLEKYYGNRAAVAEELGISTTTLWRRIKKYGIHTTR